MDASEQIWHIEERRQEKYGTWPDPYQAIVDKDGRELFPDHHGMIAFQAEDLCHLANLGVAVELLITIRDNWRSFPSHAADRHSWSARAGELERQILHLKRERQVASILYLISEEIMTESHGAKILGFSPQSMNLHRSKIIEWSIDGI